MPVDERSTLRVEGADDAHVIKHLLRRHGCLCPIAGVHHDEPWSQNAPTITPVGNDISVLEGMEIAVKFSKGRPVGFVLDADEVASNRWDQVRERIANLGLSVPDRIPRNGYVETSSVYRARVGVWLMPDNRRSGAVEEFLQDLVDSNDQILPIAIQSTNNAKQAGALFPDHKKGKATLRAWLAWQEEPGVPYGLAVSKHYFLHNAALAIAFVDWFQRVFQCG